MKHAADLKALFEEYDAEIKNEAAGAMNEATQQAETVEGEHSEEKMDDLMNQLDKL